ncbi:leucine--tRNA ligase [Candidatus Kaiserbacteria bacterium]|nr:leucine--tRNA ligase [Candidatus Kaiserbacteria bacterium]
MASYNHEEIEKKWQKKWKESGIYDTENRDTTKGKEYVLVEWPYPSGNLHIGHWFAFAVVDIYVRARRMHGKQVFFPMGFDAFGLPAENAAIKNNLNPKEWTDKNIAYMKGQLESMGNAFSWDKTTSSTDPEYYKWTQWMFTKFFENDIAYRGEGIVNWCSSCNTVLANEQVLPEGDCERCGNQVEKKKMDEWKMRITKYADRLIDDLDSLDWPESIKESQRNWIGRSEGAEIDFPLSLSLYGGEVVFATNNHGKLERMQKLFDAAGFSIKLKTPLEIGVKDFNVEEDRPTLEENAEKKARALAEKTDLPVLADDSGFFIDGEEIDPVTVKRNALAGQSEEGMTIEEVGNLMITYYQNVAKARGGSVDAEWHNAFCLITSKKIVSHTQTTRPVTLTDEPKGVMNPYLPLRSLYISKVTGKHVLLQSDEEELEELNPIIKGIQNLFTPSIKVFTTRPDTLYGATYMVLAPEHPLVEKFKGVVSNWDEIEAYQKETATKDDIVRTTENKEKTGVKLEGVLAINPANQEEIPVFIADYVLSGYGTGAIMAVPAHDERDFAFAKKFKLATKEVVSNKLTDENIFTGEGTLINSGEFDGLTSEEAKGKITKKVGGEMKSTYRLRDWSVGRQRYWGVPIPIVYDKEGKAHPVPEKHLPWLLPEDVDFRPTGEPPLAKSKELLERTEKIFGDGWTPEVETMDTFVDSSWYFLRYIDNENGTEFSSMEKQKEWMPIDIYFGGAEHTTMHLLYSRFWQKVLFDLGLVTESEPYKRRINRGLVLGPDGNKMSKSKGNVIDPDEQVKRLGSDAVKMYLAFMGPYGETTNYPWDLGGIVGIRRFLERVDKMIDKENIMDSEDVHLERHLHQTIKKVGGDIELYKFNTAISQLMIFLNQMQTLKVSKNTLEIFLRLLAPFAPHLTEELWERLGNMTSIHLEEWPEFDESKLVSDTVSIAVQIHGKVRGLVESPSGSSEDEVLALVRKDEGLSKWIEGEPKRVIYVENKLINLVF